MAIQEAGTEQRRIVLRRSRLAGRRGKPRQEHQRKQQQDGAHDGLPDQR